MIQISISRIVACALALILAAISNVFIALTAGLEILIGWLLLQLTAICFGSIWMGRRGARLIVQALVAFALILATTWLLRAWIASSL